MLNVHPDKLSKVKKSKVTKSNWTHLMFSLLWFDWFWLLQFKCFEVVAATLANPRLAAVSHLGVSWDTEVSLEGHSKLYCSISKFHQLKLPFTTIKNRRKKTQTQKVTSFIGFWGSSLRLSPLRLLTQELHKPCDFDDFGLYSWKMEIQYLILSIVI